MGLYSLNQLSLGKTYSGSACLISFQCEEQNTDDALMLYFTLSHRDKFTFVVPLASASPAADLKLQ